MRQMFFDGACGDAEFGRYLRVGPAARHQPHHPLLGRSQPCGRRDCGPQGRAELLGGPAGPALRRQLPAAPQQLPRLRGVGTAQPAAEPQQRLGQLPPVRRGLQHGDRLAEQCDALGSLGQPRAQPQRPPDPAGRTPLNGPLKVLLRQLQRPRVVADAQAQHRCPRPPREEHRVAPAGPLQLLPAAQELFQRHRRFAGLGGAQSEREPQRRARPRADAGRLAQGWPEEPQQRGIAALRGYRDQRDHRRRGGIAGSAQRCEGTAGSRLGGRDLPQREQYQRPFGFDQRTLGRRRPALGVLPGGLQPRRDAGRRVGRHKGEHGQRHQRVHVPGQGRFPVQHQGCRRRELRRRTGGTECGGVQQRTEQRPFGRGLHRTQPVQPGDGLGQAVRCAAVAVAQQRLDAQRERATGPAGQRHGGHAPQQLQNFAGPLGEQRRTQRRRGQPGQGGGTFGRRVELR